MASLFWVGGSTAYDGVTNTLATTSGGSATVAVINAGDTVTFDGNSPAAAVVTTSAAISCTSLTLASGFTGSLTMSNTLTVSGTVTLTQGTLNTNGQTVTGGAFSSIGSAARTLTLGSSALTFSASASWTVQFTNLTMTANTAVITLSGVNAQWKHTTTAGNYNGSTIVMSGSATMSISGMGTTKATVAGFTRAGTASKTDGLQLNDSFTVTGTLTFGGNTTQGVNRLLVQSGTMGTQRTITATGAAVVINGDVDFQDIAITGSPSWTNTGNAYLGDAQGNSGITFTTPASQTHTASAGGNWSDSTKWTSRVPLPQDNVVVDANTTGTLTGDMARLGADLTFTGFTGALVIGSSGNTSISGYGSIVLGAGMTAGQTGGAGFSFMSRSSVTLQNNGVAFIPSGGNVSMNGPGGTLTVLDALTTADLRAVNGTMTINNVSVTLNTHFVGSATGVLNMGSGTWTFLATGSDVWNNSGGATINAQGSTMVVGAAATATRSFFGGGQTYGTLTYTVSNSPGALTVTGANTFSTLTVGSGRQLIMPSSTTNTITNWNVNGANNGYLYLPGVAGNYASTPDSVAVSVTGDIDIRVWMAPNSWTPAAVASIADKDNGALDRSWFFRLNTSGTLTFAHGNTGNTLPRSSNSTVATGFADGSLRWVRVTRSASTGIVTFYTSTDGSSWSQLGATVATAIEAIWDSAVTIQFGDGRASPSPLAAKLYRAQIRNNVLDDGTGIVFDADFTTKTVGANSFTESSSNAATVTINGALAQVGDGRMALTASTAGTAATLAFGSRAASDYLTVQDNTATTTIPAYAGANGVLVSGTTNWLAVGAPGMGALALLGAGS